LFILIYKLRRKDINEEMMNKFELFVGLCYFREVKRKRERETENKRKLKTGKIYGQDK
jgi:hypothetical protein